jgi:hypothetical protein
LAQNHLRHRRRGNAQLVAGPQIWRAGHRQDGRHAQVVCDTLFLAWLNLNLHAGLRNMCNNRSVNCGHPDGPPVPEIPL